MPPKRKGWTSCLQVGQTGECTRHKAILFAGPCCGNYFAALFKQFSLVEHSTQTSQILLPNLASGAFLAVLDYIYANKPAQFTSHNATSIQHLALYFGIHSLWKFTSAFVKFNFSLNTAAIYLSKSLLYHNKQLKISSIDILPSWMEELHQLTLAKHTLSSLEQIVTSPKLKCHSKSSPTLSSNTIGSNKTTTPSMFP
ncbi:hypothetical protein ACHAXS_003587 [Conticribra weissflogii]